MKRSAAELVREYGPFPGVERVNGVTYDGRQIWFAAGDSLKAVDPMSGAPSEIDERQLRELAIKVLS